MGYNPTYKLVTKFHGHPGTGKIRKIRGLTCVLLEQIFCQHVQSLVDHWFVHWWDPGALEFCDFENICSYYWVVVSNMFMFTPYTGKWSNSTHIFEMGWNHQVDYEKLWAFYGPLKIYCLTDPIPVKVNEINQTNLTGMCMVLSN